jgi:lipid-A-disaccharide synthase
VLPVVREIHAIRQKIEHTELRISVVFAPCPHASGSEHEWLGSIAEIDRSLSAEYFWRFILAGRRGFETNEKSKGKGDKQSTRWDWHDKGVVLFLGGDQLNTVLAGTRLKYSTAAYCNEAVRWNGLINWIALRSEKLKRKNSTTNNHHCTHIYLKPFLVFVLICRPIDQ